MPNVRLRTIINQDNSTTFQVQFQEGGEWEDLTWDMISNKPFETLDNTVFLVNEDGVLTITDIQTVANWSDIEDKPFISLDPDDFSVSASGVLTYTGSLDWSSVVGKPFSSIDNNDFIVSGGVLKIRPKTLNVEWSNVNNKPFTYLNSSDFEVISDTLRVKHQTIPDPDWQDVQNKPFETLDANDFSVDGNGKVKVNFPQTPTGNPDWSDVQNKPFESFNAGDFTVDGNGEVSVNFPTPTPDSWNAVTNKPFETLDPADFTVDGDGKASVNFPVPFWSDVQNKPFNSFSSSDFTVDPDTGIVSLNGGGGGGNPDWTDVQNKPFNYIGNGLYVYDGKLMNRYITWKTLSMSNANKIANASDLKHFFSNVVKSALADKFGLTSQKVVDYYPLLLEGAQNYMYLTMRLDNTDTSLTQFSDSHTMVMELEIYKLNEGSSQDVFVLPVRVSGLLSADGSNSPKIYNLMGYIYATISKTDGQYTTIGINSNTSNLYVTESVKFSISTGQPT